MTFSVSAFYKFVAIDDCEQLRADLLAGCLALGIKGTILIAHEGINGTVAGTLETIEALEAALKRDRRFADLDSKRSHAASEPFQRLKIKIKREIVTFGAADADPIIRAGTYVDARDWNELIADPDVTLIDTRNAYEVAVGSFPGAIDPGTASFGQFKEFVRERLDPKVDRKIAMFCTGGIRCEKASAYLVAQGFNEVFHLRGGILKYLETVPSSESQWQGECFVFDERVALRDGLRQGQHALCVNCGFPIRSEADQAGSASMATSKCARCLGGGA